MAAGFPDRDRTRSVTPEDIQRVAKLYLKDSNRTLGEFIPDAKPDRTEVPSKVDLNTALKDYKGEAAMAQGEAFDPSPANIEARVKRSTLPDGLRMTMLEKKTRGKSVRLTMSVEFGDLQSLNNLQTVGSMTGSMLMRGTTKMDRQQVQDSIDRLRSQISVSGSATGARVSIESDREHLPAAIRFAGELLKDPSFPKAEFDQIQKARITGLESAKTEPQVLGQIAMEQALHKYPAGDLRHVSNIDESLANWKAVTIEQVRAFHKNFYGTSNGDIAIVGDFDPAETRQAVEQAFGAWKSPAKYERFKSPVQNNPTVNLKIETPDKANAYFSAALPMVMGDEHPDYPALVLADYMFGGGFLNSRLATRIRQKEGLSYGVGSRISASSFEPVARFSAGAILNPQNVGKVEAAFLDEIAIARKSGFTAQEIDAAKGGWLQEQMVGRSDDGPLARDLVDLSFNKRTMAWDAAFEAKVKALTPEQVNTAFAKWMDPKAIFIVKAGDFQKAAKAN